MDPGDTVSATLKKEFGEEALNSLELSKKEQEKVHDMLTKLFQKGQTVSDSHTCLSPSRIYFPVCSKHNTCIYH